MNELNSSVVWPADTNYHVRYNYKTSTTVEGRIIQCKDQDIWASPRLRKNQCRVQKSARTVSISRTGLLICTAQEYTNG